MRYGRNDVKSNHLPTPALPGSGSRDRRKRYSPASQPDLRPAPLYSICPAVGPHFISPHGDCQGRGAGRCPSALLPSSLFTIHFHVWGATTPARQTTYEAHPHPPQCAHWGTFPLGGGRYKKPPPTKPSPLRGGRWRRSRRMRGRRSRKHTLRAARAPACPAPP